MLSKGQIKTLYGYLYICFTMLFMALQYFVNIVVLWFKMTERTPFLLSSTNSGRSPFILVHLL